MTKFEVKDDARWSLQEREFLKTEPGKQLHEYMTKLLSGAEAKLRSLGEEEGKSVAQAFREALVDVEEEFGNASLHALGRIIIISCWHWKHGDDLFDGFTLLEKKLFSAAAVAHIEEMQEGAKNAAVGDHL